MAFSKLPTRAGLASGLVMPGPSLGLWLRGSGFGSDAPRPTGHCPWRPSLSGPPSTRTMRLEIFGLSRTAQKHGL